MEAYLKQCDALAPPLVTPLRAILWMLAVVYLPHVLRIPLVFKAQGWYNNVNPRPQIDKLVGKPFGKAAQRATAAHANSWEAFAYFGFACLTAHLCQLDAQVASSLCTLFLLLRLAYALLYIAGTNDAVATVRSLVWVAAITVSVRLQLLALARAGL